MFVCVCVCARAQEKERERAMEASNKIRGCQDAQT